MNLLNMIRSDIFKDLPLFNEIKIKYDILTRLRLSVKCVVHDSGLEIFWVMRFLIWNKFKEHQVIEMHYWYDDGTRVESNKGQLFERLK